MSNAYVIVSPSNAWPFSNNLYRDLVIYTQSNSQRILIGTSNTAPAMLTVNSNNVVVTGTLYADTVAAGNIGMFRNRIINGDMRINQRGSTSVVVAASGAETKSFCVDRFIVFSTITTGGLTLAQIALTSSDTPFGFGLKNALRITASAANTNMLYIFPCQIIEGHNMADFNWGSTAGTSATLSFWFISNVASGTNVSICLRNNFASSSWWTYNTVFTYNTVNIWQYVTVVIAAPPSSSTWNSTTSAGVEIMFAPYYNNAATNNTWQNANNTGVAGAPNIWSTVNNFIQITGVQFEKGSVATPFEFRPIGMELQLCQRYFVQVGGSVNNDISMLGYGPGINANIGGTVSLPVEMRVAGTATKIGTWQVTNCTQPGHFVGTRSLYLAATTLAAGEARFQTIANSAYYTVSAEF